jgi:hypothetical protein
MKKGDSGSGAANGPRRQQISLSCEPAAASSLPQPSAIFLLRLLLLGRTLALSLGLAAGLALGPARAQARVDVTDLPEEPITAAVPPPGETAPAKQDSPPSGVVGRRAAQKYMSQRGAEEPAAKPSRRPAGGGGHEAHYLALHLGGFVSDNEYMWGSRSSDDNVGRLNIGLTYRLGEWQNSMDLALRVDYETYQLVDGPANKFSFLPVILFPDASSHFPLYFGVGAGMGVFTKQLTAKSPISLDYQLLLGARFFNLGNSNAGFFVETGLKNHIFIFSDGQFNGMFVAVGGVFTF